METCSWAYRALGFSRIGKNSHRWKYDLPSLVLLFLSKFSIVLYALEQIITKRKECRHYQVHVPIQHFPYMEKWPCTVRFVVSVEIFSCLKHIWKDSRKRTFPCMEKWPRAASFAVIIVTFLILRTFGQTYKNAKCVAKINVGVHFLIYGKVYGKVFPLLESKWTW